MNAVDGPDKFRRYRDRQKARGLKEVRRWVYDLEAPGFRDRLAAEIARINGADDTSDLDGFLDAAWADLDDVARTAERTADQPGRDR